MHTDGEYYIGTKGNSKRVLYSKREEAPIAIITADPRPAAVSDANARLLVNANRMFKVLHGICKSEPTEDMLFEAEKIVKEIEGA